MAQSQASGGGAFYVPQRLVVQLQIDEDNPGGDVVCLEPGWHTADDVDPRVMNNPVVQGLLPKDAMAAQHNQQQAELSKKISEGGAGDADMQKLLQTQAGEAAKQREEQTEAWNKAAQAAADQGKSFTDLHPDPAVVHAIVITQTQPQYVSAGAAKSKIMNEDHPRAAPPPPAAAPRPQVSRPPSGA